MTNPTSSTIEGAKLTEDLTCPTNPTPTGCVKRSEVDINSAWGYCGR